MAAAAAEIPAVVNLERPTPTVRNVPGGAAAVASGAGCVPVHYEGGGDIKPGAGCVPVHNGGSGDVKLGAQKQVGSDE